MHVRKRYVKKPSYSVASLFGDDNLAPYCLFLESAEISASLRNHHDRSTDEELCKKVIEGYIRGGTDDTRRVAIACFYIGAVSRPSPVPPWMHEALVKLALPTSGNDQYNAVGPRQLYDYAFFALWNLYYREEDPSSDALVY